MALVESLSCSYHDSTHGHRQTGWALVLPDKASLQIGTCSSPSTFDDADMSSTAQHWHVGEIDQLSTIQSIDRVQVLGRGGPTLVESVKSESQMTMPIVGQEEQKDHEEDVYGTEPKMAFHKWVTTLHRRVRSRSEALIRYNSTSSLRGDSAGRKPDYRNLRRHKSSSSSSFGFVTAVRSASVSLASVSAVTRSRKRVSRSNCLSQTDCSSRASFSGGPRASEESHRFERSDVVDPAAIDRSYQRRRILEELINTEEGYIGDIRFLINVYITILATLPTLPTGLRSSINHNLTEIVELHEEIFGELRRVVPPFEHSQMSSVRPSVPDSEQCCRYGVGHQRRSTLDPETGTSKSDGFLPNLPGIVCDPQVAAEASKIFARKMNRFFIYKEYGAKYELMIQDVSSAHRSMPEWETYQKGIEILASTLGSADNSVDDSRKSLTIGDLLVKPIQRVCKYPLLFAELLKYTPVTDCPNSHMEVEGALMRLREATAEINRATNDTRMKSILEKTWLLQDRLVFPRQQIDAASKNRIRSFGHVRLCGALHMCWQTKQGVDGQYLVCLLYPDVLCLASVGRVEPVYTIQACIDLSRMRVEEVDNGRGLQCHTAPFSWKLVFESDYQLYEIIMTACSPKEEMQWRARLPPSLAQEDGSRQYGSFECLSLGIKSLGTVFGKPGTMARRISIHRATTVGPKSPLCQVVLKNTSVLRDSHNSTSSSLATTINRSQSLLTTNSRIAVLAPARSERARLEALLADVWSREILPYPGMTARSRSEHLVRTSASTVMRKLSVASIAGSFSRKPSNTHPIGRCDGDAEYDEPNEHHHPRQVYDNNSELSPTSIATSEWPTDLPKTSIYTKEKARPKTAQNSRQVSRSGPPNADQVDLDDVPRRLQPQESFLKHDSVEKVGPKRALLRAASMRSLRSPSRRPATSYSWNVDKEHASKSRSKEGPGQRRWPRNVLTRGENKTHAFRSIFR